MFEASITENEAQRVRNMSEPELSNMVTVKDGVRKPCSINGVEIELEWDNPNSLIISHLWIDPKIRNNGIGYLVTKKIVEETKRIDRIDTIYATIQASNGSSKHFLRTKLGFSDVQSYEDDYFGELVEGRLDLS